MAAPWWRNAVIYQIYPLSFADGDGDGVGDLRGVIGKLAYLQRLGVNALWLSPIFASPMADNGYDVSDYCAVNPLFGTLDDADELIAEARRRGLRVIFDMALNHTSTAHPWFQASLDPKSPYRDWYIWREGRDGQAPNNWRSIFGGPAWSRPEGQNAHYLHLFDRTQADLNWENPSVRAAMHEAMRFWLDRGVAGLRLDVVTVISKPDGLGDAPGTGGAGLYHTLAGGPRLHEYLRELRREVFAPYGAAAIGEGPGLTPARARALVDPADPMLDMIYHFDLVEPEMDADGYDRRAFKAVFDRWDRGIGPRGWNSCVLSNHDVGRVCTRFGDGSPASAKALLAVVLLQRATPFLYQGDELGLVNSTFTAIDQLNDVWARTTYARRLAKGDTSAAAFAAAAAMTRDHARTPFPWTDDHDRGWAGAPPWLPHNAANAGRAAATQDKDADSVLAFARRLLALRRSDRVFVDGDYRDRAPDDPDLYVFERRLPSHAVTIRINLRPHAAGGLPPWGVSVDGVLLA